MSGINAAFLVEVCRKSYGAGNLLLGQKSYLQWPDLGDAPLA
jgi:hypothetical protein